MRSMAEQKITFSFIVPVYNTGYFLYETLDSINNQKFNLNKVEVIVVNDCSTDDHTNAIVKQLETTGSYKNLNIKVIQNNTNKWLAETRNVGARVAIGKYLVCLDSDDTIEPEFLELSSLTFAAYPSASWVYPSVRKFGYKNQTDEAPFYNAKKLFLQNYIVAVSPVKRSLWNKLNGQRTLHLANGIKLYEDWDFWQRAIGKGAFGVPMKKVLFNYRQNISSLVTRSEDEGSLSSLLAYKNNWRSILGIKKSQHAFQLINDNHTVNRSLVNRVFQKITQLTIKRKFANIKPKDLLLYLFWTSKFVERKLNPEVKYTKAHKMAGFIEGFKLDFDKKFPVCATPSNQVLVTHFWWHVGGAENILLSYIKELKLNNRDVIDVVINGNADAGVIKNEFGKFAKSQYTLEEVAQGPYPMLLALWEIIKIEKPGIILNMSNPLLYVLTPLIKEKFPNTIVYDLLHCEDYDDNGWFEAAYQFQPYIDKRIVTSDFWKEVLIKKYSERSSKIEVIHNMIDYDRFSNIKPTRNQLLEKYGIDTRKKIIGFLGRLQLQKRPDIFLRVAEIMQGNSDYHFVMAGDGDMYPSLVDRIKRLSNLTYIGATKNPEQVFPMYDVAIFPSKYEGYPLVGIECAYIGLPFIASNIVGFREQIENGKVGMLYNIMDDETDAASIKLILLNQYNELIELGKNGSTFINKYHNRELIKADIKNVFGV
jgi:glycosyltransferase involved in cell wall biosynthesis